MAKELYRQKYNNTERIISGIGNLVYPDDSVLLCDTSGGVVELELPTIPQSQWSTEWKLYVVDNSNNAGTNNITIKAPTGYLVNGQTSIKIDANSLSCLVRVSSDTNYIGQYPSILPTVSDIIPVTYLELVNLINSSTLKEGKYYKITDYVTVHRIPTSNDIHTGTVEPLIVTALSSNKITTNAYSEQYPFDIIEYNYLDNLAENGTTPRNGKITYRKDTINNLSTYYDFRNVSFYRYELDYSAFPTWNTATFYNEGTFIAELVSPNNYRVYYCRVSHLSGATFTSDLDALYWVRLELSILWSPALSITYKLLTRPSQNIFQGVWNGINQTLVKTFEKVNAKNISIGKISSSLNYGYNNVVIYGNPDTINPFFPQLTDIYDIKVDDNTYDCTIYGDRGNYYRTNTINIGKNCSGLILCAREINIGDNNMGFIGTGATHSGTIGNSNSNFYLGDLVFGFTIENSNINLFLLKGINYFKIGNNTNKNYFRVASDFNLGHSCFNNLFYSSYLNNIGELCNNLILVFARGNTFSQNCSFIKNENPVLGYGEFDNNIFGQGCFDIYVYGSLTSTTFGVLCNNINVNTNAVCNNSTFGSSCSTINIDKNFISNNIGSNSYNTNFNEIILRTTIGVNCENNEFNSTVTDCIFGNNFKNNIINDFLINSSFCNNINQHTFNASIQNCNIQIPTNFLPKVLTNSIAFVSVPTVDTNGDYWYINIDTLGVITTTKWI